MRRFLALWLACALLMTSAVAVSAADDDGSHQTGGGCWTEDRRIYSEDGTLIYEGPVTYCTG